MSFKRNVILKLFLMSAPQMYTLSLPGFCDNSDLDTKGSTDVLRCLKTAADDQPQMSLQAVKEADWEMITTIVFDISCKEGTEVVSVQPTNLTVIFGKIYLRSTVGV
jgi:hypothetical protein